MFLCPKCPIKLQSKNEFVKHMDGHQGLGRSYYPCPICKIDFSGRTTFYKHMETHGNQVAENEIQRFLCRHCRICYSSIKALEDHLKTLEKIPCPFCRSRTVPSFGAYKTHKSRWVTVFQNGKFFAIDKKFDRVRAGTPITDWNSSKSGI